MGVHSLVGGKYRGAEGAIGDPMESLKTEEVNILMIWDEFHRFMS